MRKSFGKFQILLFIGILMGSGSLSAMEIKSDAEAMNNMGKLRMLSWRILNNRARIGMDSTYGDPKEELKKTVTDFNEIVKALNIYVKDPKVKEKLKVIEERWKVMQASLNTKLKLSDATTYYDKTVALKKTANDAVNMMGKGKNIVTGKAGRLRAVSQALSALYSLKTWGMKDADKDIVEPMKSFRDSLDFLKKDPATDSEMTKIIQKLEKTYLFFYIMNDAGTMTPHLAIKKTNDMLKDAGALTQLYVKKLK